MTFFTFSDNLDPRSQTALLCIGMATLPNSLPAHAPNAERIPAGKLLVLAAGAALLLGGAMALFVGAPIVRQIAVLFGVPASTWDGICGPAPVTTNTISPWWTVAGVVACVSSAVVLMAGNFIKRRWVLLGVLAVMAAASAGGYVYAQNATKKLPAPPAGQFTRLSPPRTAPDFLFRNTEGGMNFRHDFEGKPTLFFFGYTHCPDICPTTLVDFKKVKQVLGADGDNVNYVFISVDGERDTPELLARYVRIFDPAFKALVADPYVVSSYLTDFGGKVIIDKSNGGYKVSHTSDAYLVDATGQWRAVLPLSMSPEDVAKEVQLAMSPAK
jgi:protein SCO1/2